MPLDAKALGAMQPGLGGLLGLIGGRQGQPQTYNWGGSQLTPQQIGELMVALGSLQDLWGLNKFPMPGKK